MSEAISLALCAATLHFGRVELESENHSGAGKPMSETEIHLDDLRQRVNERNAQLCRELERLRREIEARGT